MLNLLFKEVTSEIIHPFGHLRDLFFETYADTKGTASIGIPTLTEKPQDSAAIRHADVKAV